MAGQPIPYPADYDVEAEIADKRYAQALKRVTVYDVLAVACDILSGWEDYRTHPLHQLGAHVLRHGSYKRSGKPAHFTDRLTRALEDVLDQAVDMCVADQLSSDHAADMALDLE